MCFFLNICMEMSNYLLTVPLNQILERIICEQVFSGLANDNDPRCKDQVVQRELSFIRGWQLTFDVVPGLLTAMLYGLATKRYGRQFIMGLAVLGGFLAGTFVILICSFPAIFSPRLIWLSSAFAFIGGGAPVFNAMSFALLSEAVHQSRRSTVFFYLNATNIGSQVVAGLVAFALMRISPWVCIYCGALFAATASLVAFLFPAEASISKFRSAANLEMPQEEQTIRTLINRLGDATIWLTHGNFLAIALLSTLLVTTLGRSVPDILLQYVTKRYELSWSDVSTILLWWPIASPDFDLDPSLSQPVY
ncbi:hypothetical protein NLG97_g2744 [Lecanicillium saksenae]|uniref:Uncharacterized protein n=1 Tax=Lecanicillium saksenae TaxID=468837 RepID=A0ACC1R2R0_9HYPO|nr:hypothetical protein NLG97_g2744 [Lecanicillium saksenae]